MRRFGSGLGVADIVRPASRPNLFLPADRGAWFDPAGLTGIWQDAARTVPGAIDQPVGCIDDVSGNGNHAVASGGARPILRLLGARPCLEFDGVDDCLVTAAIDFTGTDAVTMVAGIRTLSSASQRVACELGGAPFTNSFGLSAPRSSNNYSFRSAGSTAGDAQSAGTYTAPDTAVLAGQARIATDSCVLRRNGVQIAASAADQGSGAYGNAPLYVGSRSGSGRLQGYIFGLVVLGRMASAGELAQAEAWMNGRTGAF